MDTVLDDLAGDFVAAAFQEDTLVVNKQTNRQTNKQTNKNKLLLICPEFNKKT